MISGRQLPFETGEQDEPPRSRHENRRARTAVRLKVARVAASLIRLRKENRIMSDQEQVYPPVTTRAHENDKPVDNLPLSVAGSCTRGKNESKIAAAK